MNISEKTVENVHVIKVRDHRIDTKNAPDLKEALTPYQRWTNERLVLDLSDIDFMDSSGLGVIVTSLKSINLANEVGICGLREPVYSMIKLTRIDKVFHIYASEQEAVGDLTPTEQS